MKNIINKLLTMGILGLAITLVFVLMGKTSSVYGSAPSGLPASQRVATTTSVGPQQNITLFNANPNCSSRVISTAGRGIVLLFADPTNGDVSSTTLSSIIGFSQAASTTQAYDSGIYGCGRMVAFGLVSTTTITIAEF